MSSPPGHFSLVLHAHLPFVRHPEHEVFLEERWLFEAVAGCYLPLLDVFERLAADGVPYRVTISFSPTLVAMLDDDLLRRRCRAWLQSRCAAAAGAPAVVRESLERALAEYERRAFDPLAGFQALAASGHVELITTAATHGFLPLLKPSAMSVRAQIRIALDEHSRRFGRKSRGFWLPECGFYPGLQHELAAAGIEHCVVDAHAFHQAQPAVPLNPLAPVACDGVVIFARDADSAREVWGPGGFPSAAVHRDFHATDVGGFKLFAVGDAPDGNGKRPYDPEAARDTVHRQAAAFVSARARCAAFHAGHMATPPVIVSAYDAELFGHWWFEGPQFIEQVFRLTATAGDTIRALTLAEHASRHPPAAAAAPGASSWGQHGYNDYWLNASNHWIYPDLRRATARFAGALRVHAAAGSPRERALRQAGRSLLLAQASDWPFLMTRETSAMYAGTRLKDQLARVHYLCDAVERNDIDERRLRALEQMDNLFPRLDCRHFIAAGA